MMIIKFHPKAKKEFLGLSQDMKRRISRAIEELRKFPNVDLDIKVLKGLSYLGFRFLRARVGEFRIVFVPIWSENTIFIIAIGRRKKIYEKIKHRT